MIGALSTAADGLRSARIGAGQAASDVVRAAQSASTAYQRTAAGTSFAARAPAPIYTPPSLPPTPAAPDLATATVALTRAEIAYKASAAVFKSADAMAERLLDAVV